LYTTDETMGGHLRAWDVSDAADPFEMGSWSADPEASIHNVVVQGDSAYCSYYTEGLQVLDISNPFTPAKVASYDTYPGAPGGFNGCWGVYPFARNHSIYLSDIQGGLFVVGLRPEVAVTLQEFTATASATGPRLQWRLQRDALDRGVLVVSRAAAGTADFAPRARLGLDARTWVDAAAVPGHSYQYRLAWDDGKSVQLLGETRFEIAGPSRSRLLGNAPNPFNPSTRVRFELARAGSVTLAVFDARGRLVRELSRAGVPPGANDMPWDGCDLQGRSLPSGNYFYEIRSTGWSARGRMTLAK